MGFLEDNKGKFEFSDEIIKALLAFEESIKERKVATDDYIDMTTDELVNLSVDKMFEAAMERTYNIVNEYEDMIEGINALNVAQRVFYSVNYLDMEVQNGGLCQFFVNSSRAVAPMVSEHLEVIGAIEHKQLYDDFVTQNQIDLNDLSSFDIDDISEFENQTTRYPFDDFDNTYMDLPPLEDFLKEYVKKNIKEF